MLTLKYSTLLMTKKPYPTLFGIDWAIYNHTIMNLKKAILTFEYYDLRVVAPIDLLEAQRYVEPVK